MKVVRFVFGAGAVSAFSVAKNEAYVDTILKLIKKEKEQNNDKINQALKTFASKSEENQQELASVNSQIKRDKNDLSIQLAKQEAQENAARAFSEAKADADSKKKDAEVNLKATNAIHKAFTTKQDSAISDLQQQVNKVSNALEHLEQETDGLDQNAQNSGSNVQATSAKYEQSSGQVLNILRDLKQKLKDQHTDAVSEKTNADNAFALNVQDLNDEITAETTRSENAAADLANANRRAATAEQKAKELQESITSLNKKASDLTAEMDAMSAAHTKNMNEMNQLKQALLEVSSIINQQIAGSFMQMQGVSFVQLHAGPEQANRVAAFLNQKAQDLKSNVLSTLATQVSAGGPFNKVVDMITKLLEQLNQEAAKDAGAHGKCTAQKAELDAQISDLNKALDKNQAEIDTLEGSIDENTDTIDSSSQDLSENQKNIARRNTVRQEEKKSNEDSIAETEEAIRGITSILKIIRDKMTSEVQARISPIFEAMLNEYSQFKVSTTSQERDLARMHAKNIRKLETENARLTTTVDTTKQELAKNKLSLAETRGDKSDNEKNLKRQQQLLALNQKQCNNVLSHEEKMAKMNSEIQSLKEALEILREV